MALTVYCECGESYQTEERYAGYKIKCARCGGLVTIEVNQALISSRNRIPYTPSHNNLSEFQVKVTQSPTLFYRSFLLYMGVGVALLLVIVSLIITLKGRRAEEQVTVKEQIQPATSNRLLPQQNPSSSSRPQLIPTAESNGTLHPNKSPSADSKTAAIDFSDVATPASGGLLSDPVRDPILNATPIPTRTPVYLRNGTNIKPPHGARGLGTLKVSNGTSLDGAVKLINTTSGSKVCRYVYVRAGSEITLSNIGPGTYILQFGLGMDWDENTHTFLRDKSYSQFDDLLQYSEIRDEEGINFSKFEVTLHPVLDGTARTLGISEKEFQSN